MQKFSKEVGGYEYEKLQLTLKGRLGSNIF